MIGAARLDNWQMRGGPASTRPAGNSASSCTEQAALITTARIVESVPDMDSKFSAATQTMGWSATVRAHQRA